MDRICRRCGDWLAWMSDATVECVRCGLNLKPERLDAQP